MSVPPTSTDPTRRASPGRRAPGPRRPPRSRRRRLTYWVAAAVVVVWALAVGITLVLGLRDASHATAQITSVKNNLSAADLVSGGPGPRLAAAGAEFARAK